MPKQGIDESWQDTDYKKMLHLLLGRSQCENPRSLCAHTKYRIQMIQERKMLLWGLGTRYAPCHAKENQKTPQTMYMPGQ